MSTYSLHINGEGVSKCRVFEITLDPTFETWTPEQSFDFVQWFLTNPPPERHDGNDDEHLIEFVKARRLVRLCKHDHELFAFMILDRKGNDIMLAGAG